MLMNILTKILIPDWGMDNNTFFIMCRDIMLFDIVSEEITRFNLDQILNNFIPTSSIQIKCNKNYVKIGIGCEEEDWLLLNILPVVLKYLNCLIVIKA